MMFPVIELFDRLVIAQVKYSRTQSNIEELNWYNQQVKNYNTKTIQPELEELSIIHNKIWDLESLLKSGKEHELPLDEIGRRAIEIRNWNNRRVTLKNRIAEILECSVREIKKDHLSQ